MPGQFQLPGIFRWTPIADQLWAPAVGGETRGTLDTPNSLNALITSLTVAKPPNSENAAYEKVQSIPLARVLFADFPDEPEGSNSVGRSACEAGRVC